MSSWSSCLELPAVGADEFDGKAFTWHVATPTGISTSKANSSSSDDDDSGYGY